MKLRTEMYDEGAGTRCGLSQATFSSDERCALTHDAAAAHALMLAIGEFYAAPLDPTLTTPEDAINWLEWRASELMRSWGFDTGEDA